jgi:hypothetical protein
MLAAHDVTAQCFLSVSIAQTGPLPSAASNVAEPDAEVVSS